MSHQNKPKKRDMEKTSINEQGGDVNHMTGIPLFTVRLFMECMYSFAYSRVIWYCNCETNVLF